MTGDAGEDTWVALLHVPGPHAPAGEALFTAAGFEEHRAFLGRMNAAGYLVAAGPLLDQPGAGMTILRLPGPGRFEEVRQLATQDDRSVATGFFSCQVRPWNVLLTAATR